MAEQQPMPEQALCYTAAEDRQALNDLVCGEGVVDVFGGDLLVTTAGSGLNLLVAAGSAYIQGDNDADQGMYRVRNDASVTLTATGAASPGAGQLVTGIPNANGTNPRIDQVVAVVRDSEYVGISDDFRIMVLTGTATGTAALTPAGIAASAAALPTNTIRLAYILVPTSFAGPFVNATHISDARAAYMACGGTPILSVYRNAADATHAAAEADFVYDTVAYNTFGPTTGSAGTLFATNTGIFVSPFTGLLRVRAAVNYATTAATDYGVIYINVNGTNVRTFTNPSGVSGVGVTAWGEAVVPVTAGQNVKIRFQLGAGPRAINVGAALTFASFERVAA